MFDTSIPVLTEVIEDVFAAEPAAPSGAPQAEAPRDALARFDSQAHSEWSAADWDTLERRLSERILRQLQSRVDFVLEQRIKDSMADVLQHALAGLTGEIRTGLQQTIEKIVARAVTQELAHLQTYKK